MQVDLPILTPLEGTTMNIFLCLLPESIAFCSNAKILYFAFQNCCTSFKKQRGLILKMQQFLVWHRRIGNTEKTPKFDIENRKGEREKITSCKAPRDSREFGHSEGHIFTNCPSVKWACVPKGGRKERRDTVKLEKEARGRTLIILNLCVFF